MFISSHEVGSLAFLVTLALAALIVTMVVVVFGFTPTTLGVVFFGTFLATGLAMFVEKKVTEKHVAKMTEKLSKLNHSDRA